MKKHNKAKVFVDGVKAGVLEKLGSKYIFNYLPDYNGPPVSLTMPIIKKAYVYDTFPPFFEGLLPEGVLLDALLRKNKLDRYDYFGQLMAVGHDMVGAITVEEEK